MKSGMNKTGISIIGAALLLVIGGLAIWKIDSNCDAYRARAQAEADKWNSFVDVDVLTAEDTAKGEPPWGCSL